MAGLGRGLDALLSASNRNKAKFNAQSNDSADPSNTNAALESIENVPHGQTVALNNLLSTKSLKSRQNRAYHAARAVYAEQNVKARQKSLEQTSEAASISSTSSAVEPASTISALANNISHVASSLSSDTSASTTASTSGVLAAATSSTAMTASAATSSSDTASSGAANISSTSDATESLESSCSKQSDLSAAKQHKTSETKPASTVKQCTIVVEAGDVVTPPLKVAESSLVRNILLQNLKASVYQPRTDFSEESLQELAASIKEHGLLEPLLVTRSADGQKYEIICGERRFRAAQMAGLHAVPCLIRELSDEKAYAVALIENIQREDLSPLEIARAYEQMIQKCQYTHESLAKSLGMARSTITNTLRLLKLEPQVKQALRNGEIDVGHAKILLGLQGEHQIQACSIVVAQKLSVAATDVMVKDLIKKLKENEQNAQAKTETSPKALPRFNNYEKYLNKSLKGVKAKFVVKNENQGKLTLSYTTAKELDFLLKLLGIPKNTSDTKISGSKGKKAE